MKMKTWKLHQWWDRDYEIEQERITIEQFIPSSIDIPQSKWLGIKIVQSQLEK